MKKKLQPALTLLQHYMAQDMTVYAGHATLFLLTAFFPLLMWLLVVVNTLPGFTVEGVVELFFRFLPDLPVIRDTIAGLITSMNENSNTFVASLAVITTLVSASSGMAAIQKGLQKLTPGSRRTMLDRLWAVVYTFAFLWLLLIVLFIVIYISNRYSCQRNLIEIDKLQTELKDARYKAQTTNNRFIEMSRESRVLEQLKACKDSTLHMSNQPPYLINVPEK